MIACNHYNLHKRFDSLRLKHNAGSLAVLHIPDFNRKEKGANSI